MKTGYELLLPAGLLDYFEVVDVKELDTSILLFLDEQNLPAEEFKDSRLISKGFYPSRDIHDFPLRGKSLILKIRRRRWQNLDTGLPVMRNWSLVAEGTRLTQELASFLKGLPG